MGQRKIKLYQKVAKDAMEANATSIVKYYLERLCRSPFKTRWAYAWQILRKHNPHTGEKVREEE